VIGNLAGAAAMGVAMIEGAKAPVELTLAWLLGVGLIASTAEGVLTAIALDHLERRAPALVWDTGVNEPALARQTKKAVFAFAIALGLVLATTPLSSTAPDALETVVERLGSAP
jgi:predicted outer membrane lipoprotein